MTPEKLEKYLQEIASAIDPEYKVLVTTNTWRSSKHPITADDVLTSASMLFGVSKGEIVSPRRNTNIMSIRHACIWWMKKTTDLTLAKIGSIVGGRDHSTVINSISTYEEMLDTENKLYVEIHHKMKEHLIDKRENQKK